MDFIKKLVEHFGTVSEANVHPHCPQEKAELFQCTDGGSTEFEILNLLNSLICCYKPLLCLETGTYRGFGTLAMASALKQNKRGRLVTLDQSADYIRQAKAKVVSFDKDFESLVDYCQGNSLDWIRGYNGEAFDFIFFDSDIGCRPDEFKLLSQKNLIKPGAICFFHDTSPTRWLTADASTDYVSFVNGLLKTYDGLSSDYSKGFVVVRISPDLVFDEKYYLDNNPDVANFIKQGGPLRSGYEHYLTYGYIENRKIKWEKI